MSATSIARKRWATAGLLVFIFVVSFATFDRLLLLGLRASASRYYASLDTGTLIRNNTTIYGQGDGNVLIFGTSRSRRAFVQPMLSAGLNMKTINVTDAGRFPHFYYLYYLKYRKEDLLKPKAVFYGIDYFIFEKKSFSGELAGLNINLKLDALNPAGSVNEASPLLSRVSWLFRKKQDIDNYLGDLIKLDRAAEGVEEETNDGAAANLAARQSRKTGSANGRGKKEGKPHPYPPRLYKIHPGVEGAYLQRLLAALEEDGVPVFLVIIPDYAETNETNFEQDKFKSDIKALARPYENVTVLDFNRPEKFDLKNPKLFRAADRGKSNCHLTSEGSNRFTRILVETILPILNRETAPEGTQPRLKQ